MFRRSQQKNSSDKQEKARWAVRLLKEPVLHFFVLGLVVFGLHALFEKKPLDVSDPYLLEVSSADIEWVQTMWTKRMNRQPTAEELRGMINQMIREQVLSREAVAMGLDEGDIVVRRRLSQKMDFLFKNLSSLTEPTEEELREFLEERQDKYTVPPRATFSHVYFSTDARGQKGAEKAAESFAKEFKDTIPESAEAENRGDPFLLPSGYAGKSVDIIGREFGDEFARAILSLEPGMWHGPVPSGYGVHAVFIHDRSEAQLPDFEDMKDRLQSDWLAERQRTLTDEAYQKLRNRYQVLVEGLPYKLDVNG